MELFVDVLQGRVVKFFNHGNICLFQVASASKKISALISKEKTTRYPELCKQIKLGSYIRGQGFWQQGQRTKQEFVFLAIDFVADNSLEKNETGLMADSSFRVDLLKKRYHTYLCASDLCSTHLLCKGKMLYALRRFLNENGYLEVNTPVLNKNLYAGGARPFITHMIDNGSDMYMRVTSEIALKMVIGGGFERVYEIGQSFRNGSVNKKYLTPFTGAEIYTAFTSEEESIKFAENIINCIEKEISPIIVGNGYKKKISFANGIPQMRFEDYFFAKTGHNFDFDSYMKSPDKYKEQSNTIYKILKNELIPLQQEPIFITDLPAGNSPLIASKSSKTLYRSYLVASGATMMEIAIGENDADKILEKIKLQGFDDEYKRDYSNFIHAYQMGMPPISSVFIGIDRIVPAFLGIEDLNDMSMLL